MYSSLSETEAQGLTVVIQAAIMRTTLERAMHGARVSRNATNLYYHFLVAFFIIQLSFYYYPEF